MAKIVVPYDDDGNLRWTDSEKTHLAEIQEGKKDGFAIDMDDTFFQLKDYSMESGPRGTPKKKYEDWKELLKRVDDVDEEAYDLFTPGPDTTPSILCGRILPVVIKETKGYIFQVRTIHFADNAFGLQFLDERKMAIQSGFFLPEKIEPDTAPGPYLVMWDSYAERWRVVNGGLCRLYIVSVAIGFRNENTLKWAFEDVKTKTRQFRATPFTEKFAIENNEETKSEFKIYNRIGVDMSLAWLVTNLASVITSGAAMETPQWDGWRALGEGGLSEVERSVESEKSERNSVNANDNEMNKDTAAVTPTYHDSDHATKSMNCPNHEATDARAKNGIIHESQEKGEELVQEQLD